jgi:hypothetical protein
MNHRRRKLLVSADAALPSHDGFVRPIIHSRYVVLLILFLITSGSLTQAAVAQRASRQSPRSAIGNLKIWVPAGMIGDDYWIYVNGHLTSAPPHGPAIPKSKDFLTIQSGYVGSGGVMTRRDGWDLWTGDGLALAMRHEEYDNRLIPYINAGDKLHVFQVVELPLAPETYTIEVALYSPSYSDHTERSFPFVITRKYVVEVRPGQTTQLYPGVPDDWDSLGFYPARAVRGLCNVGAAPPDVDELKRLVTQLEGIVRAYMDDPMVKLLRGLDRPSLSRPKGTVVLDLPPAQGGPRELDATQVRAIAGAISARHAFPDRSAITECQRRFPQIEAYAAYGKMIGDIESDMESFFNVGKP